MLNLNYMKTPLFISGVLLLFVCSCEPFSHNHTPGSIRNSHLSPRALSRLRDSSATVSTSDDYYYTTVTFPPDYDWRRDSSYGAVQASVNLYRNDSLLLQVPTGSIACPDADLHHFIQGHLYTQYRSAGRTVLARDGQIILELDHEAILAGLLPLDGKLYTLWKSRTGDGFSLLDGDTEMFSRSRGQPLGSLSIDAYTPGGALYPDLGKPCFCYRDVNDWYVVRDFRETAVKKPYWTVFDMRSIDGQVCIFYHGSSSASACFQYRDSVITFSPPQYKFLKTGYIYDCGDEPFCAGTGYQGWDTDTPYTIVNFLSGQSVALPGNGISLLSASPLVLLFHSSDGSTGYYSGSTGIKYLPGSYYQLSPHPGISMGGKLYIALNPTETGSKPGIWKDWEIQELEINGFISGIYQSSQ